MHEARARIQCARKMQCNEFSTMVCELSILIELYLYFFLLKRNSRCKITFRSVAALVMTAAAAVTLKLPKLTREREKMGTQNQAEEANKTSHKYPLIMRIVPVRY